MPGLWELPTVEKIGEHQVLLRVRHAITNTDYRVTVIAAPEPPPGGRWITARRAAALPLTGLTRKILQRLALIQ